MGLIGGPEQLALRPVNGGAQAIVMLRLQLVPGNAEFERDWHLPVRQLDGLGGDNRRLPVGNRRIVARYFGRAVRWQCNAVAVKRLASEQDGVRGSGCRLGCWP